MQKGGNSVENQFEKKGHWCDFKKLVKKVVHVSGQSWQISIEKIKKAKPDYCLCAHLARCHLMTFG